MDDVRLFTPNVWDGISSTVIDNWLRSDDVSQFSCHPMDNLLLVDRKLRRNSSDIVKLAIGDRASLLAMTSKSQCIYTIFDYILSNSGLSLLFQ